MKLNRSAVKQLRQVQQDILTSLHKSKVGFSFDMSEWFTFRKKKTSNPKLAIAPNLCATAGCVAGSIIANAGYSLQVPASAIQSFKQFHDHYDLTEQLRCKKAQQTYTPLEAAANALRLDAKDKDLEKLFIPCQQSGSFWQGLSTSKPADAIVAIQRFIDSDGISSL